MMADNSSNKVNLQNIQGFNTTQVSGLQLFGTLVETNKVLSLEERIGIPSPSLKTLSQLHPQPKGITISKENEKESELINQQSTSDSELENRDEAEQNPMTAEDGSGSAAKLRKKRKNFSAEEDKLIQEGFQKFGGDWGQIVNWSGLDRTPAQVKERYKRINKKEEPLSKRQKIAEDSNGKNSPIKDSKKEEIENAIIKLEKDRKYIEEKVQELQKKEQMLQQREENLMKKEEELHKQQDLQELKKEEHRRKILIEILREKAMIEKQVARAKQFRNCERLGQVTFERAGTSFVETWQEGQAFKDLAKKQVSLNDLKEQLEKEKRELSKLLKKKMEPLKGKTDEIKTDAELDDLLMQEELVKLTLLNIKKEESELQADREKLIIEKNAHIRELKRIHDEDQSRFNNHCVLAQRYLLQTVLGKGGFSEVYLAFDLQDYRQVACKIHQLNSLWNDRKKENYVRHAVRESNIQKSMSHPKIVGLYDVFEIDENSFCTVLEYCNGPDLDLYLKQQIVIGEKEAKAIMKQLFSGLEYLNKQKKPIIHYDLKPGNILFHNGEVKITDFGLSKIMEENETSLDLTSQGAGTYWYLPPECFEVAREGSPAPKISSKVDVWSAGVIFYQMLYGKKPFGNNLTQQKILADNVISNSKLEFPAKPVVSKEGKDFIVKCLSHNLSTRPDVSACVLDPYLKLTPPTKKEKKIAT